VFNEGDVLMPKIANVKLLAHPSDTAKVVATLARTDELVVVGAVKDGSSTFREPPRAAA